MDFSSSAVRVVARRRVPLLCARPPFFFLFTTPRPPRSTLFSLHDALPISTARASPPASVPRRPLPRPCCSPPCAALPRRSEEHTSELQSLRHLVCRLLLEKKNTYT